MGSGTSAEIPAQLGNVLTDLRRSHPLALDQFQSVHWYYRRPSLAPGNMSNAERMPPHFGDTARV